MIIEYVDYDTLSLYKMTKLGKYIVAIIITSKWIYEIHSNLEDWYIHENTMYGYSKPMCYVLDTHKMEKILDEYPQYYITEYAIFQNIDSDKCIIVDSLGDIFANSEPFTIDYTYKNLNIIDGL